ncbi:MAG: hypothetical protein PHE55_06255 [Methylococcaceae bacterium]|nr:hypothetical protein [Methylococcaceae bacterium]
MMRKLLLSALAFLLLVEEWLWETLTALGQRLSVWLHLQKLEHRLAEAKPEMAMAAFLLPVVLILPVKFAVVLLIAQGRIIPGLGLLIIAKLFATLLVSRIFAIARPQLLTVAWFAIVYNTVTRWVGWAHERIRATAAYRQMVKLKQGLRAKLVEWLPDR